MDRLFPKSLEKRWNDPRDLIQVFIGPRQVGKTTAATKLMDPQKTVYASADLPSPPTTDFITDHWKKARAILVSGRTLILDEVQKIPRWSEVVKQLWDEDRRTQLPLRVCLLGSSALLMEKGLSESLTGRFEMNYFPHWTYLECHQCFQTNVLEYAEIGGYPKTYELRDDKERLERYVQDSILEPTLGRDILALHSVEKPALLRQLFWYISRLPAQTVSFEKILAHLQGKGNSATLVHYAELLKMAFLLMPLAKFSKVPHRTKRSIPKWILPNPGLVERAIRKEGIKGFVFENLVGSHLLNIFFGQKEFELKYWREDKREIDFILTEHNLPVVAIEVKSGRLKKIIDASALKDIGIDSPLKLVTSQNIQGFLETTTVSEILAL